MPKNWDRGREKGIEDKTEGAF